jgi:hypothetical protein
MTLPPSGKGGVERLPEKTTTVRANFASAGRMRIDGSSGDLNVQGWDRPEVEVTVMKSLPYGTNPKQPDPSTKDLESATSSNTSLRPN